MHSTERLLHRLKELNEIGIALSQQRDINSLLETILEAAKRITHADAGTLYLHEPEQRVLRFEIMRTDSLNIAMGGSSGVPITFYPIHLYDKEGKPIHSMVVSHSALSGETVNISDAYAAEGYDFSGTKKFDAKTGYRSQSFLAVPMRNHENEIIGVLQLINAQDRESGAVVPFSGDDQQLLESLASQAAIALTNRRLIAQLEELFESFIQLINTAIDDKSPYTAGHCARVPVLTMMLAEAVNRTDSGPLKDFVMSEKDRHELKMAGLLHDCGKITTPVHVVDKSTKLHTLLDRIHLIDTRFGVLKRDAEIAMLRALSNRPSDKTASHSTRSPKDGAQVAGYPASGGVDGGEGGISEETAAIRAEYEARIRQLDDDCEFLRHCNIGGEAMSEEAQQRVRRIAAYQWRDTDGKLADFLSGDEIENLNIRAGTLTAAERETINHHIVVTIKMLESLPWPKNLNNVPEYAGGHHERMDGKGYPRGLTREQMSVQARMMGIADIFEALTAKDRPYKLGKTLTESLTILGKLKLGGHIDPDLFDVFIREKVYLDYANQFLAPEQIDAVDLSKIPGVNLEA
ncbi:MAG: phosphohydrolase [Gallionellales bacterium RIFCSPLOWO2_12_FULL_59_22]|nr:MAG: phosphohydrolase [Gallionellales bacterium RIFCSPLOWO2_02_FULL_59_110]OGT01441.1 MAG: phosphohydrolase [Gallionellales bacterium RIFCSPLOWO2_02_58_13]OGT14480.1 MAG: phosphohydrolase [Gallionellales bacterium RIFCSPLOWO2_12_FULL_59_22]